MMRYCRLIEYKDAINADFLKAVIGPVGWEVVYIKLLIIVARGSGMGVCCTVPDDIQHGKWHALK